MALSVQTIDCNYTGSPGVAAAYLIRSGDEAAFVETNTTQAVPQLLAALDAAGLAPEQVRYVVVTHIHLDHAGGAGVLMDALPSATLLAHPKAAPHAIDPARIVAGASEVYGAERFAELYGEVRPVSAQRVEALDDGAERTLGDATLRFLHTRGHANHHFVVHAPDADTVFTGDSFGVIYPAAQRGGAYAIASTTPTDFDAAAAHASVDRIVGTGVGRVHPTHFGELTNVAELAGLLHEQLDVYGGIVDEADASGRDGDALDAFCEAEVRALFARDLAARGLSGDATVRDLVELDAALNAQGIAFAVRKRRFKRSRA